MTDNTTAAPPATPDRFYRGDTAIEKRALLTRRNRKSVILFVLSAIYGTILLGIFQIYLHAGFGLAVVAIYAYAVTGFYGVVVLNQRYSETGRQKSLLAEVLDKSAEPRIITDTSGRAVYANQQFRKLTGSNKGETIYDLIATVDQPESMEQTLLKLQEEACAQEVASTDVRVTIRDRTYWLHITCMFVKDMNGYINWRFDDITLKRRMQDLISEEREKLRDFTDNAPVGFFAVDGDGKFRFANETLLRLLGSDRDMLIGKAKLHDFLVTSPRGGAPYDCFSGGGMHQYGETLMKGAGGREFKAAITHSLSRDNDGNTVSRSIIYDLTSEQKMQQALRESQDRFERLFKEAPVGICLLSPDGTVSDANESLSAMLAIPADELNGKKLESFIPSEMRDRVTAWLTEMSNGTAAESSVETHLKSPNIGKNDGVLMIQLYARKLQSDDHLVLHFINLTDQKNLEKQFTQSQKMQAVGQLAGGIAHDFNNLLTAMIGFCDLLLLRHKPGDTSFADIMQIKQNANRAANLVRQLLAFSRQQTLQARTLDLTEVLSDLSHLLRRLIGANIEMTLHHESELAPIRADQGQMDQVIINLVVNARDAMANGGKLDIRTRNFTNATGMRLSNDDILPPGQWVTISVSDNGTGIPADIVGRIFDPFFSTKDVGAGTGLGLATVHGIIHQTGGHITVDSTPGRGTTFTVYLPAYHDTGETKPADTVEDKKQSSDLTGSARILLVEDEDPVRAFSTRALSNKGYEVMDASGGHAALQILEDGKFEPAILITDVMMPEMDGTTLAKHVREKYPHVKIIFISGYAEDRFKEHLGADVWFLPKPFTLKQLATKVKEVMEEDG